jgi:hypothetical protein
MDEDPPNDGGIVDCGDQLLWQLWQRLLGRPVSEYGGLCHGDGGHEWGDCYRRALMLTCMKRLAVSSRRVAP